MTLAVAAAALAFLPGCVEEQDLGGGKGEWKVARKSGTESFDFENAGTRAEFNAGYVVQAGSMLLEVTDASGRTVYARSFDEPTGAEPVLITATTAAGEPGTWSVVATFRFFTGEIGIVAEGRA